MSISDFFRRLFAKQEPQLPQQEPEPKRPEERYILCIDGGGMRGIVPVVILQKLEQCLRANGGNKDIATYFDMIAGTSTGGLIALALTNESDFEHVQCENGKQISLDALLDIYMTRGKEIFQPTSLFGLGQIARNKYHSRGIEHLTQTWFGDAQIKDSKVPTLAMAYDLASGKAQLIRSYAEESFYPVWLAARATSAAPSYFKPYEYDGKLLADGGVIANNPVLYAYIEAKKLYPECQKFHILSISTGGKTHTMDMDDTAYGLIGWAGQVHPMYSNAQKQTSDYVMANLQDVEYLRLDDTLPEPIEMDDTNPVKLQQLKAFATESAQDHAAELDDFAIRLIREQEYRDASETGRTRETDVPALPGAGQSS